MKRLFHLSAALCLVYLFVACSGEAGVYKKPQPDVQGDVDTDVPVPVCEGGTDNDGDGYGPGCPAGPDCNDDNPNVHPGRPEVCNNVDDNCNDQTDEGVLNACGNCSTLCGTVEFGTDPLPLDGEDPNVNTEGVGRDPNGDIVITQSSDSFYYLWIANTNDLSVGTVSKVDTRTMREVARYFSVTCFSRPLAYYQSGSCLDTYGTAVQLISNSPSRTAVDFNFDVWVANRAFGGQASTTKISNNLGNCIDRNGDGVIQTSADRDGNGIITTDCDANGSPDNLSTLCTNGLSEPEFYGLDDECVMLTTNYGMNNQLGRCVCLDKGSSDVGASNVWVATYQIHGSNPQSGTQNVFYQINGMTGEFMGFTLIPSNVNCYGCTVDGDGVLWVSSWGLTTYIDTVNPAHPVGRTIATSEAFGGTHAMYGITTDSENNIWYGGWNSNRVYRYRPHRLDRSDPAYFTELGAGTWTMIEYGAYTGGISADLRGFIWVANNNGFIARIPQSIADGVHDASVATQMNPTSFGGNMRGSGIDFDGHVWGVSHDTSTANRIELDAAGNATGNITTVPVGTNPYTYSDFTGYGLRNFTRPQGTFSYTFTSCPDSELPPTWYEVRWNGTTPPGTSISAFVQTSNDAASIRYAEIYGPWETSPAVLSDVPGPVAPNPAWYIRVTFLLTTENRDVTPILHDFDLVWECAFQGPAK
ncbi:MAG: hypothetical protein CVU59_12555 [Deltaproteobacteria bacterium HGW-Deltaproteobacteria-17]|nr:MAG: hypothetical protein CVU59_12555 [Deltaproteobacteria bacterium HGW-Deltaproteobacteria-17]